DGAALGGSHGHGQHVPSRVLRRAQDEVVPPGPAPRPETPANPGRIGEDVSAEARPGLYPVDPVRQPDVAHEHRPHAHLRGEVPGDVAGGERDPVRTGWHAATVDPAEPASEPG